MEENKVAQDSSAPTSPEMTRLSVKRAEDSAAREIRKCEFIFRMPLSEYACDLPMNHGGEHRKGNLVRNLMNPRP